MNTPKRKHKPKDQLLSKPVKLKSDPAYLNVAGGEDRPPQEPAAEMEAIRGESTQL